MMVKHRCINMSLCLLYYDLRRGGGIQDFEREEANCV